MVHFPEDGYSHASAAAASRLAVDLPDRGVGARAPDSSYWSWEILVRGWQEVWATTGSFVVRGCRISLDRDATKIRKRAVSNYCAVPA